MTFSCPAPPMGLSSNRLRHIGNWTGQFHLQIPFPLSVIEIDQILIAGPNRAQADAAWSMQLKLPTADPPPHDQWVFYSPELVF